MTIRIPAILAAILAASCAQAAPIRWVSGYGAALKTARQSGKLVMLAFYTDWCPWCHRMDSRTYADPKVAHLAASMVAVKLNGESDGKTLAERFHVTGFPTVLFLNGKGEVLSQVDKWEDASSFALDLMKVDRLYRELPILTARLTRSPQDPEANARLATARAWQGRTADAEAALARARAANYRGPELAMALNAIGDNYQTAGRLDQAILRFAKADALAQDQSARSYARMSIMACHIGRFDGEAAKKAAKMVVSLRCADREWVEAANRYLEQQVSGMPGRLTRAGH